MTYEGLGEMFEGDSADTSARQFPLMLTGGRANGPACADGERGPPSGLAVLNKVSEEVDKEVEEEMEKLEAETRQIYDPKRRIYDDRKRKVTDLKECARITLPKPMDTKNEAMVEMRRGTNNRIFEKYTGEVCNKKGEVKGNLSEEEKDGLRRLQKRIKEN